MCVTRLTQWLPTTAEEIKQLLYNTIITMTSLVPKELQLANLCHFHQHWRFTSESWSSIHACQSLAHRDLWIRSRRCRFRSTFLFLVLLGMSFAARRAAGMLSMWLFQCSNVLFEQANTIGFQCKCLESWVGFKPRTNLLQCNAVCYYYYYHFMATIQDYLLAGTPS